MLITRETKLKIVKKHLKDGVTLHQVLQPRTNSHKAENKSSRLQRKTTSSCGMMWVKKTLYKKMGKEHEILKA